MLITNISEDSSLLTRLDNLIAANLMTIFVRRK